MHSAALILLFSLAHLTLGTPVASPASELAVAAPKPIATHKLLDFEDGPEPNIFSFLFPELNKIGKKAGLNWQGFIYGGGETDPIIGVKPQSGTHVAAYGLGTGAKGLDGPAILTPLPGYDTFDIDSFYFACVFETAANTPGISVTDSCSVVFKGYKPGSEKVFGTTRTFKRGSGETQDMEKATFDKDELRGLERLEMLLYNDNDVAGSVKATLSALLLDNFGYTLYSKKKV
ncbi:uncharacterized protein RCC_06069 [Ramularia collo-cygni]|uniref:Uncharacterized protein n=1 Tax=Ramularia collo-cygni TaxID=112498 RepID=A0A2D3USC2_9PEZI|nr:uncharacterized protein RCC_06069 [Ramularia collo-cygni]CZT20212.1 uncharacterized protein RCC_06069 [Ramularia collo-cygni]